MTTYALVRPDNSVDRVQSNIDPTVGTKPGWAWLPLQLDEQPAFNAGLEQVTLSEPVKSGNVVVRTWTKARKSLAAQKAAVKAEAQRRIIVLTGTADLTQCMIKQSNANMRANELNDKRIGGGTLTAEEEAEAQALRDLATAIKAIRAASNVIEALAEIPLDYTADSYWP
jgi:hypothetical protein